MKRREYRHKSAQAGGGSEIAAKAAVADPLPPRLQRLLAGLAQGLPAESMFREMAAEGGGLERAITTLIAHDLVRRREGVLVVTGPGRSYLRRVEAAKLWRKRDRGADVDAITAIANTHRDQHTHIVSEAVSRSGEPTRRVWVNRDECPLGWLRRRRDRHGRPLLSEIQFEAGERLRTDFETSGILPRVTASWDGTPAPRRGRARARGRLDPTEAQIAARQRYERALATLAPGLRDAAVRVCCYREGLGEVERSLEWPVRSGKLVLCLALDQLAKYYGIG